MQRPAAPDLPTTGDTGAAPAGWPQRTGGAPPSTDPRVLAELAQLVRRNLMGNMLGNLAAASLATLMAVAFFGVHWRSGAALTWLLLQGLLCGLALRAGKRAQAGPKGRRRDGERPALAAKDRASHRLAKATRMSAMVGLMWGLAVLLMWSPGRLEHQVLLMFLVAGMVSSALHSLNPWPPAFHAFLLPAVAAVMLMALLSGDLAGTVVGVSVAIYGVTTWHFAKAMHRTQVEALQRRFQVEDMALQLHAEKERAEAANLAKSHFLAAASHDLRQPVHALAMFTGALQLSPLDAATRHLAAQIDGSVGALGKLFDALLDISRLDAGVVQPQIQAVALLPLLQRLADESRVLAQAKGLALRVAVQPGLTVRSDPVLLERIVQNLLGNAVRYTERGSVLLAARSQGDEVLLRVLDSGSGIAREHHEQVFVEFVQLHNPARDRHQGLGLGLAVVRRLTALLGHRLSLRSKPGRGTAFVLRLPRAVALDVPEVAADAAAAAAVTTRATTATSTTSTPAAAAPSVVAAVPAEQAVTLPIVVVDDDADVREGMRALLHTWGHRVHSFGGWADLQPWLATTAEAPGLLITDYRLRDGESGLELVDKLRNEFLEQLPAIVITGDTGAKELREAVGSGLLVLHKPVSPAALRAAMVAALESRPAAP